mmetsp:Transcript_11201/g.33449  ORF Transcript_11201/g.33449 Transcript_11201/m.33449 type:complete len:227 (+) Transcript_11201:150-830(+)
MRTKWKSSSGSAARQWSRCAQQACSLVFLVISSAAPGNFWSTGYASSSISTSLPCSLSQARAKSFILPARASRPLALNSLRISVTQSGYELRQRAIARSSEGGCRAFTGRPGYILARSLARPSHSFVRCARSSLILTSCSTSRSSSSWTSAALVGTSMPEAFTMAASISRAELPMCAVRALKSSIISWAKCSTFAAESAAPITSTLFDGPRFPSIRRTNSSFSPRN